MNLQQVKNGIYYSKAIYDFADSMNDSCFKDLKMITRDTLKQLKYPLPIPQFQDCTLWVYFDKLERVFDYTPNDWKSNVGRLLQFFDAVQRPGMEELYRSIFDLNKKLNVLLDGDVSDVDIDNLTQPDESMDFTIQPSDPIESDEPPQPGKYPILQPTFQANTPFSNPPFKLQTNFDPKECYPIKKVGKRGLCLIVNMFRIGAGADVTDGGEIFEELNYEVMKLDNITFRDYMKSQKTIRKKIEDLNSDSFILIFSSHGDEKDVVFADNNLVPREEIILRFLPSYCPCLEGKPKLFFFQNCRGTGLYSRGQHDLLLLDPIPDSTDDSVPFTPSESSKDVPKDILKYFATTEGHVAYRLESGAGSIFLQALFEILRDPEHVKRGISVIQPILSAKVLEHSESGSQLPDYHTTLLKQFYFKHPDM